MKTKVTTLSTFLLVGSFRHRWHFLPSFEQPLTPTDESSPWSFRVGLYGWLQAVEGDVAARGISTPVDAGMDDILRNLDLAVMGVFEVGYGRWSFLADSAYVELSANEPTPKGLIAPSFDVGYTEFVGNYVIGYELMKTDQRKLDIYAGARVTWLELEFDLGPFNRSADHGWVDPIIGARYQAELGEFSSSCDPWRISAASASLQISPGRRWPVLDIVSMINVPRFSPIGRSARTTAMETLSSMSSPTGPCWAWNSDSEFRPPDRGNSRTIDRSKSIFP